MVNSEHSKTLGKIGWAVKQKSIASSNSVLSLDDRELRKGQKVDQNFEKLIKIKASSYIDKYMLKLRVMYALCMRWSAFGSNTCSACKSLLTSPPI